MLRMKLDPDRVPSTHEDAVQMLLEGLHPHDVQAIHRNMVAVEAMHFSIGRYVRNCWSLWDRETALVQHYIARFGLAHADDLSGLMLRAMLAKAKGVPFDPKPTVDECLKHWREQGVDPITLQRLDAP